MDLLKKIGAAVFALGFLVGLAAVAKPLAKAASQTANLHIATEVSNDNGRTWTTEPVCVNPGDTYQYRTTVWNTGDTTANQINGTGSITNGNYIQSVSPNTVDEDGDGYGYTSYFCDPNNPNGYLGWAPAGTTQNDGQTMIATVRVTENAPCGSIICQETINTYDTHQPNGQYLQYIGRALANTEYVTGDRSVSYTVTVNREECPCVKGTTTLPQTGDSVLDLVKSLL